MALESKFQTDFNNRLRETFPGCIILKNDSGYMQGIPDWLLIYRHLWAMLEYKASRDAETQPNQPYYVELLDSIGYSAFVYPRIKRLY